MGITIPCIDIKTFDIDHDVPEFPNALDLERYVPEDLLSKFTISLKCNIVHNRPYPCKVSIVKVHYDRSTLMDHYADNVRDMCNNALSFVNNWMNEYIEYHKPVANDEGVGLINVLLEALENKLMYTRGLTFDQYIKNNIVTMGWNEFVSITINKSTIH